MDNLPLELYFEILNHCDLIDLFTIRLISKKFKQIVNYYTPKELVFHNSTTQHSLEGLSRDVWFASNKSVVLKSLIDISKFKLLNFPIFNVQKLRRLRITINKLTQINFKILSSLNMLESLMINLLSLSIRKRQKLAIDSLKSLHVGMFYSSVCNLDIDCPNLESLSLNGRLDSFQILNTSPIKYLKIRNSRMNYSNFKNVEHFDCDYSYRLRSNLLDIWPQLKIIQVESFLHLSIQPIIDLLKPINNANQNSRNLKIFFKGIQVLNQQDIQQIYEYKHNEYLSFHLNQDNNHRLTISSNFVDDLFYSDILSCYQIARQQINTLEDATQSNDSKFFDNFRSRFPNIQIIMLDRESDIDESILSKFISNYKSLYKLSITNCNITQSFLDQLNSISKLMDFRLDHTKNLNLDFKFINKMNYLERFVTNQSLRIDNDKIKLSNLAFLKMFEFRIISRKSIRIEKKGQVYKIVNCYDTYRIKKSESFDWISLIEKLKDLADEISIIHGSKRKINQPINSSKKLKVKHEHADVDSD